MTGPVQGDTDAAGAHESVGADDAAADAPSAVPADLFSLRADPENRTAEPARLASAVSALLDTEAASLVPTASPAAPEPRGVPVTRPGPRLGRLPTLAIRPSATMPRRRFELADLEALATSIKRNGLAQPLLVRINPAHPESYELIAGYRRWRAALLAEVPYVPAVVFEGIGEAVGLELGLLENLHRRDLTVIEEAESFRQLAERFGRTHDQIAALTGRSRSQVTNMLRLLALPDEVKDSMHQGRISFGHARALLTANEPTALARRIVAERLTVRETELLAGQLQAVSSTDHEMPTLVEDKVAPGTYAPPAESPRAARPERPPSSDLGRLQSELAELLGVQFELSIDASEPVLAVRGRSVEDINRAIAILRDALKLLRMNRTISTLTQDLRAS